ncbi:MAG TPA: hypothetical protein VGD56_03635 [Gemmatirosa sp.]
MHGPERVLGGLLAYATVPALLYAPERSGFAPVAPCTPSERSFDAEHVSAQRVTTARQGQRDQNGPEIRHLVLRPSPGFGVPTVTAGVPVTGLRVATRRRDASHPNSVRGGQSMGKRFQPNEWKDHQLTVAIYWRPRTGPEAFQNGHAALIIDTQQHDIMSTDYYASWVGTAGNPFVNAARQERFYDDAHTWGGEQVGHDHGTPIHVPTKWVAMSCLDIGAVKAAWDLMRNKAGAHWKIADKNCATAVARLIKAGGGDHYAKSHKSQLVWWPTDIIRYAKSMKGCVAATSGDA